MQGYNNDDGAILHDNCDFWT